MQRSNLLAKLGAVMAVLTISSFGIANAATASAATAGRSSPEASVHLVHQGSATSAKPELTPKGCNGSNFCSYNEINGGHLCFQTDKNVTLWPEGCANSNQSAYNRNGNAVDLYWGDDYSGAYFILYSGNYLLYMSQNTFNECKSCDGYGQEMADNVASSRFL